MATNQKFVELNLGLLNSAQDATNVKDFEGVTVSALEVDQIALGTLQSSDYFALVGGVAGAPNDQEAIINGANFRISDGSGGVVEGLVQYESILDWLSFSVYRGFDTPQLVSAGLSATNLASSSIADDMQGKIVATSVEPADNFEFSVPNDFMNFRVDVTPNPVSDPIQMSWSSKTVGWTSFTAVQGASTPIKDGVHVTFAVSAYVAGATGRIEIESDDLSDGDYAYRVSMKAEKDGVYQATNGDLPTLAPSDSQKISVTNFDDQGDRTSARTPAFEVPLLGGYETLVYRRDEEELDFFNVTLARLPSPAPNEYYDTQRIVEMDQLDILEGKDENETEFNIAINNPSEKYDKLFSKDNRLFRVPRERSDLIMYSRAGAWWGWQRENSFATDAPITSIISVRDPSTVGGTLTTVIFTETGLYHLTGNGTEADPYVLTKQIDDISVDPKSIINMNGILMFATTSDDGTYNKGAYGQKVYEYDLQKLVEVSARIQNNATLNSTAVVEFAEMIGGDKYFLKKVGVAEAIVYHRDAQGWGVTTEAAETANSWAWKSKDFTPTVMHQFKLGYARKFKLDFIGEITIKFNVWYEGRTDIQTYELAMNNAGRGEVTNFLPQIKGTVWNFELIGNNAELYNMYLVR